MPSRLYKFLEYSAIKGDPDDPRIHRRLGIELEMDGFDKHYHGLRKNPDATLVADIEALRDLAKTPEVQQERAKFATKFREYLGEEIKTSEAVLVNKQAETVSIDTFIHAQKPVLMIGGRGPVWESENPAYSNLRRDPKKVQSNAIAAMERYIDNADIPVFLALFSASAIGVDRRLCDTLQQHADPHYIGADAKELVDKFILPRLNAAWKNGEVDEEALRRQARFTMQRVCFGDVVGKQMDAYLPVAMREAGFAEKHITLAQEQMFVFSTLGTGGRSEAPLKTFTLTHAYDTYPARYGHDTSTHEHQIHIESHSPSTEIGFHHPKIGLDTGGLSHPYLFRRAIQEGIKSQNLPDLQTLYNPERFRSETPQNALITVAATQDDFRDIRNSAHDMGRFPKILDPRFVYR